MYLRTKFSMPVLSENLIKAQKKCRPKLNMKLPSQQTSLAIHTIFSSAMLPKGKHSAEKLIEYSFFLSFCVSPKIRYTKLIIFFGLETVRKNKS